MMMTRAWCAVGILGCLVGGCNGGAGGTPLDCEVAKTRVRELFAWFTAAPDALVAGRIVRVDPPEGLHSFYFDRTGYPSWPPFAASERWTPSFEGGFLYEFPTSDVPPSSERARKDLNR